MADILQDKGVEITEDDDMASLIGKVDELNIGKKIARGEFSGAVLTKYNSSTWGSERFPWIINYNLDFTPSTILVIPNKLYYGANYQEYPFITNEHETITSQIGNCTMTLAITNITNASCEITVSFSTLRTGTSYDDGIWIAIE